MENEEKLLNEITATVIVAQDSEKWKELNA